MPLRTLLGYEPRNIPSRESFGGNFISFAPNRGVMATKKQKYQAPMARVKKLPPIDEENANTPRPVPRNTKNVSIRRVPKSVFESDDEVFPRTSPVKQRPILHVQPVPRAASPPPIDKYIQEPKKAIPIHYDLSPKDVNHTIVDGLVADYLHYARYGHVIPVYEGTSSMSCPCCTDRNRQNVRSLLGFPKGIAAGAPTKHEHVPTKYDHKSSIKNLKMDEELGKDATMYPNSLYAEMQRRKAQKKEPSPEEKRLQQVVHESRRQGWMNYQPLPYATNYLNPEFNRPSEMNTVIYDTNTSANQGYMKYQVLEADTNYDSAMNKLSGYT